MNATDSLDNLTTSEQNPYLYLRIGEIKEIYLDKYTIGVNPDSYMTVRISWFDFGSESGAQDSLTNIVNITLPGMTKNGGVIYVPSVGDTVVCGNRIGGYPVLLGYWANMLSEKSEGFHSVKEQPAYYFRDLIPGEYYAKVPKGAEFYMDRLGNFHAMVRDQSATHSITTPDKTKENIVDDVPSVELTLGKTYGWRDQGNQLSGKKYKQSKQYDFNNEVKSPAGKSTKASIRVFQGVDENGSLKVGATITIDEDMNIDIVAEGETTITSKKQFNIDSSEVEKIIIGDKTSIEGIGGLERAVLGESLIQWLKTHIHGGSSGPTTPPQTPPPDNILSKKTIIE